jgi:hypothetical protein
MVFFLLIFKCKIHIKGRPSLLSTVQNSIHCRLDGYILVLGRYGIYLKVKKLNS